MLQLLDTRINRSTHYNVLSSSVISEEGQALVYVRENGQTVVTASTGTAGEIFAGVSISRYSPPSAVPLVEQSVVPVALSYSLNRTPITGQLLVKVGGNILTIGAGAPADATYVQLVGNVLTFFAGTAGQTLFIQYLYSPTLAEARTIIGDAPIGGVPSAALGIVGVLEQAQIGTSFYDASVDWTNTLYAKLGANGIFTVGTSGDHLSNVVVLNTPNASDAYLSLSINVA